LRGNNGRFYDGALRVPYLVQWTGVLPAGKTYHNPVSTLDVFATAVAAAGGELPQDRAMDGVNLVPYLTGRKCTMPHEFLCWLESIMTRTDNVRGAAVRSRKWKMVKIGEQADRLYDLSTDIGETNDIAHLHPGA
jgi:arylsulfatase A-like enzyme